MKVLILSDLETHGGAAAAASRLSVGLLGLGHQVARVAGIVQHSSPPWKTIPLANSRRSRILLSVLRDAAPEQVTAAVDERVTARNLRKILEAIRPDVISVHNIHFTGWKPSLLEVCCEFAPVTWTLHDAWSFTGRCVYPGNCTQYLTGCDERCPTPTQPSAMVPHLIAGAYAQKKAALEHLDVVGVAPSRWMAATAGQGMWRPRRMEVIPNGVPTETYAPVDKGVARAALALKARGPVLMMAAQSLEWSVKGADLLRDALVHVNRPVTLLTLGHGTLGALPDHVNVVPLGHLEHERMKALAYCAADLFVQPSREDNLPNVVMEAMACGTPVVAFSVGGVVDMVRPGVTGWLATELTGNALAAAIHRALDELRDAPGMRASCRAVALEEYPLELQARRHVALFQELISQRGGMR